MKKIPSFTIDHIRLLRGIYVSRKDEVNGEVITTFDIRMKEPNREPALGQGALHTIEHLAATYLRNNPQWQDRIIYWGPMGCLTGNYLLMRGDLQPEDILPLMQDTFRFIAGYEGEVPGAAPQDCGNYLLHDLPMARWESAKYLHEVLEQMTEANIRYPEKAEGYKHSCRDSAFRARTVQPFTEVCPVVTLNRPCPFFSVRCRKQRFPRPDDLPVSCIRCFSESHSIVKDEGNLW